MLGLFTAGAVLSQVFFPPLGAPAFDVGSTAFQPTTAETVRVAVSASAIEALWLDGRRSSTFPEQSAGAELWWVGFSTTDGGVVVRRLEQDQAGALSSPAIELVDTDRAVAFVRGNPNPAVVLRRWAGAVEQPLFTVQGEFSAVALAPARPGFAMAYASDAGVSVSFFGTSMSRKSVPSAGVTALAIEMLEDGGVLVGAQTANATGLIHPYDLNPAWQTAPFTRFVGLSRTHDAVFALAPPTSVSTVPMTALPFNLPFTPVELQVTSVSTQAVFAMSSAQGAYAGTASTAPLRLPDGRVTALELFGNEGFVGLAGRPGVVAGFVQMTAGLGFGGTRQLPNARPATRSPSLAWNEASGAFMLVWSELGPTGWVTPIAFLPVDGGAPITARLLDAPSSVRRPATLLQVTPITAALASRNGEALDVRSLTAAGATGSSMLSLDAGAWLAAEGSPLFVFRASQQAYETQVLRPEWTGSVVVGVSAPRCAVAINDVLYIAGWRDTTALVPSIVTVFRDAGVAMPVPLGVPSAGSVGAQESVCTTARSVTGKLVVSWQDGVLVRVATVAPARLGQVVRLVDEQANSKTGPIAVENLDGPLSTSTAGDRSRLSLSPSTVALAEGGVDVAEPALAVSPRGHIAIAWQEEDLDAGAVRVRARMLLATTFIIDSDGGLVIDAGAFDGGRVDAGTIDAGLGADAGSEATIDAGGVDAGIVADAGTIDAGTGSVDGGTDLDAGTSDAGAADGGLELSLVPACSCASTPGWFFLSVLGALLLARRRVRTR